MTIAALVVALVVGVLGALGLAAPDLFVKTVAFFQVRPALYLATLIRIAIGVVLLRVAGRSRAVATLRTLGAVILMAGILTPVIGERGTHVILDWWTASGPPLVRMSAALAVAVGGFIAYAVLPRRGVA